MANGQGVGIGRIGFSSLTTSRKTILRLVAECIFFSMTGRSGDFKEVNRIFPCRYNVRVGHKVLDFRFD